MKNTIKLITAAAFFGMLMSACGTGEGTQSTTEAQPSADENVIEDQLGREVTINENPENIVVGGILPYFSTWYVATDSTEEIAGMHPNSYNAAENSMLAEISPEVLDASTDFVKNGEINIEELMKINPHVYFEKESDEKTLEKVAEAGIPSVGLQTNKVADSDPLATFNSWLELTADIKGGKVDERVDSFMEEGSNVQNMIDDTLKDVKDEDKPRVLFLHKHSDKSIVVGGANFFSEKWTEATGGIDIVGDDGVEGMKEVNMEQVYEWDPDIIYITNFTETQPDDLLEDKVPGQDWSEVKAVQEGNVHKVPLGIYRWFPPNGDAPLMLKWLAQHNHPDKFDYDIKEEIKTYYKNFYDFELSDEEVDSILHPSSEAAKY
ncbi:ABC transporter substrate-binding protein [Salinicoccus halodurans]|uniref:ABC transporter substrate-binding protein n=1 Tax=Salinicoccus halodurans TaxID=407035 RepID=A0A0F7D3P4_9STAP|nr:ABC transporter substrate-binding protein [Salinicoccus halodurans]AKG72840.1 ABC transporter substrate-binding protein [Salinicoccus halodurans]SFK74987.1 iron complex transport system substrate-binding protein [Salinicoccus halodurans]